MVRKQQGMGVIGGFVLIVFLVCAGLVTLKVVPVWIEYFSIKKVLAAMENGGDLTGTATPLSVRQAFDRRADIDSITVLTSRDLEVKHDGADYVVSFQYQASVPLFGNASIVFDFAGSSKDTSLVPHMRPHRE